MKHAGIVTALGLGALLAGVEGLAQPGLASPTEVSELSWMSGVWEGTSDGVEMEEYWTSPRGGTLVGMHRDVAKGRTVLFEFMRIEERDGALVYLASPKGAPATPFRLVEAGPRRAVFANPEHDFPQRILYWREGCRLRAGSKAGRRE